MGKLNNLERFVYIWKHVKDLVNSPLDRNAALILWSFGEKSSFPHNFEGLTAPQYRQGVRPDSLWFRYSRGSIPASIDPVSSWLFDQEVRNHSGEDCRDDGIAGRHVPFIDRNVERLLPQVERE